MGCPVDHRIVFFGNQQSAAFAIHGVGETVTVKVDQCLGLFALDRDVGEDHFIDAVEVPLIKRCHLIDPLGYAGINIAGEDGHGPLVIARTLGWVPG